MPLVALKTETYSWAPYAKLNDFILLENDRQLPGYLTIDLTNVDNSLESELNRLRSSYGVYDDTTKKVVFGPWFDPINDDEIKAAIKAAMN